MSFSSFWVLPNLGFASEPSGATDARRLATMSVTHVLDLRAEAADQSAVYAPVGIHYLRDPMVDDGRRQPVAVYTTGVAFARQAMAQGGKVLVHCAAGKFRSPSMVYAVLRSLGYTPNDAWDMVLRARPSADRQYVSSAEAAVPYLAAAIAQAPSPPSGTGENDSTFYFVAGTALAATATWFAVRWYKHRQAR